MHRVYLTIVPGNGTAAHGVSTLLERKGRRKEKEKEKRKPKNFISTDQLTN